MQAAMVFVRAHRACRREAPLVEGAPFALKGDTLAVASLQTGTSIFVRQGEHWVEQAQIDARGNLAALDGETLVIGDPLADSSAG